MMSKGRIEAFSDGVVAIVITIMAFDLKLQELPDHFAGTDVWQAIGGVVPKVLSYLLSFVVLAIMWLNHHSLFDKIPHATGKLVWHNMFLLFAMSLVPMPTNFLASHPLLPQAAMLYGGAMFLNALAFWGLRRHVEISAKLMPYNSKIHRSNAVSTLLYLASIPLALVSVYLSFVVFVGIPLWYFLPERVHR